MRIARNGVGTSRRLHAVPLTRGRRELCDPTFEFDADGLTVLQPGDADTLPGQGFASRTGAPFSLERFTGDTFFPS